MTNAINFSQARFLQSAPTLQHCPADFGAEIAFAGRSNAGKSSAINVLTRQQKLARISKTPGRTQLINFFQLNDNIRLVDLPGYGFAKVPLKMKKEWDKNLAEYLQDRQSLKGLVLLMDIRHPLQDYDRQMIHWAEASQLPLHILLTKADKLKFGPAKATLLKVQKELASAQLEFLSLQLFSALKREGLDELEAFLRTYLIDDGIYSSGQKKPAL